MTTNYCTISDSEIMKIMGKVMKDLNKKDLQDIEKENKRKVKADFFNLNQTDYCTFE